MAASAAASTITNVPNLPVNPADAVAGTPPCSGGVQHQFGPDQDSTAFLLVVITYRPQHKKAARMSSGSG